MPAEALLTAPEADYYLDARPGTVRGWAHRYHLQAHGTRAHRGKQLPLYALGDVLKIDRQTRLAAQGRKRAA